MSEDASDLLVATCSVAGTVVACFTLAVGGVEFISGAGDPILASVVAELSTGAGIRVCVTACPAAVFALDFAFAGS